MGTYIIIKTDLCTTYAHIRVMFHLKIRRNVHFISKNKALREKEKERKKQSVLHLVFVLFLFLAFILN